MLKRMLSTILANFRAGGVAMAGFVERASEATARLPDLQS
jgi:hypothetical protein